jgi:hypothetical protein
MELALKRNSRHFHRHIVPQSAFGNTPLTVARESARECALSAPGKPGQRCGKSSTTQQESQEQKIG